MARRLIKWTSNALAGALLLFYFALLVMNSRYEVPMTAQGYSTDRHRTVAIFGATGTVGDGLLKAALNDPNVHKVRIFTRRPSPRIEAGVTAGKVEMIIHKDYLDYSAIIDELADVDAVFWAIGLSAMGMNEETYREIHLDYPARFLTQWLSARNQDAISFHYVSGSGTSAYSRMMWAREKARAEGELSRLAADTNLRVISYRPAVILPTETEAHLIHRISYAILSPIKVAVAAESIGQSMLEVSARGQEYPNSVIVENKEIVALSRAYQDRMQ